MATVKHYAITLPGDTSGHAPAVVVTVHLTNATGPEGFPVYADDTGRLQVEITDTGVAKPVPGTPGGQLHACLRADPLL